MKTNLNCNFLRAELGGFWDFSLLGSLLKFDIFLQIWIRIIFSVHKKAVCGLTASFNYTARAKVSKEGRVLKPIQAGERGVREASFYHQISSSAGAHGTHHSANFVGLTGCRGFTSEERNELEAKSHSGNCSRILDLSRHYCTFKLFF